MISRFILFAYFFGFATQFAFYIHPQQTYWLILSMWTPTIAVLLAGTIPRQQALSSMKVVSWKYFPAAFAIGIAPYFLAQIVFYFFHLGELDPTQSVKHYAFVLALNPVVTGLLGALGEEIGWRGFLQPTLERRFSRTNAYLMVGIVWAYWHIPANLGGHNGVEHPFLNTFIVFPMTVIFMAFAFGWLRSRSGSIWPCVYLHGVINSVSNSWVIRPYSEMPEKISIMVMWAVIGLVFFFKPVQFQNK